MLDYLQSSEKCATVQPFRLYKPHNGVALHFKSAFSLQMRVNTSKSEEHGNRKMADCNFQGWGSELLLHVEEYHVE